MADGQKKSTGELLQSLPKPVLFAILMLVTSVPLFFGNALAVPNKPDESTVDFFKAVMTIPEGSKVLIASDWTNSTRGESGGHFEALMRILMRRNIKFALYTTADPQAPQVARDAIMRINAERKKAGEKTWDRWNDWVVLGYLPNAEAGTNAIANNFRTAFSGKKDFSPDGGLKDVFQSPVLQEVTNVSDFKLLIVVTASKTSTITIERITKLPLAFMVTGVMGPETRVYYSSHQLIGMAAGLKGVYDLETLMEKGVPGTDIKGFPGQINAGKGSTYYPTLHFALALMILAVVIGNVGMAMAKGGNR